jgi:predicted DNA-binding transcriptional regulator AlpA
MTADSSDQLCKPGAAAQVIGVTTKHLARWRMTGKGPRFIKLGAAPQSQIRYRRSDIDAWLDEQARNSTTAVRG